MENSTYILPRAYEMMAILLPDQGDEVTTAAIEKMLGYITDEQGTIDSVASDSPWGRRRLAYTVRHEGVDYRDGHYVLVYFTAMPSAISEIERELKLDVNVIRYLLLTHDPHMGEKIDESAIEAENAERGDAAPAPTSQATADTAVEPTTAPAEDVVAETVDAPAEEPVVDATEAPVEDVATEAAPVPVEDIVAESTDVPAVDPEVETVDAPVEDVVAEAPVATEEPVAEETAAEGVAADDVATDEVPAETATEETAVEGEVEESTER